MHNTIGLVETDYAKQPELYTQFHCNNSSVLSNVVTWSKRTNICLKLNFYATVNKKDSFFALLHNIARCMPIIRQIYFSSISGRFTILLIASNCLDFFMSLMFNIYRHSLIFLAFYLKREVMGACCIHIT